MRQVIGFALAGLCFVTGTAFAGGKYALVIGNAGYQGADRLTTPVDDATLIADRLRQLGFRVTQDNNLTRQAMFADVTSFAEHAQSADVVVFYYAGHGFEVDGGNYLMPVSLPQPIDRLDAASLRRDGVSLAAIRGTLARTGARASIIIVDACRTPPGRGRSTRTMAAPPAANGVVLAWSTAPGGSAIDSMQALGKPIDHSPFAYYLAANLSQPQLGIIQVLQRTQEEVSVATGNVQRPWYSSGLVGHLRLAASNAGGAGLSAPGNALALTARIRGVNSLEAAIVLWADEYKAIGSELAALTPAKVAALQAAAATGNHRAQLVLGIAYVKGTGVVRNLRTAASYYTQSAQGGYAPGETSLGVAYRTGLFGTRDTARGATYLHKAANAGDSFAQYLLWNIRLERDQHDPKALRADRVALAAWVQPLVKLDADAQLQAQANAIQERVTQLIRKADAAMSPAATRN